MTVGFQIFLHGCIWVSFCRAGILAVLCPFLKSRVLVGPNLMRQPRFFNCQLFIICFRCQKHFGWTCGTIIKYPNFDRFYPTIGGFGHILRSDYSLPVTKRVQLDMDLCSHHLGNCIQMILFFWFLSSSSKTGARAVWS